VLLLVPSLVLLLLMHSLRRWLVLTDGTG